MNKKLKKTAFRGLGRTKNGEKWLSNPLDEQKIGKNGSPTPWMSKKWKKNSFPTPWMSKKWKRWLSNPLEVEK